MSGQRRCACGTILNSYNLDTLCGACKTKAHGEIEIAPEWLALIEDASDHSIRLAAEIISGRKEVDPQW